jgi:serine/threonine protein kinase
MQRGEIDLLRLVRSHGPFEDWHARPRRQGRTQEGLVLARRPSGERSDAADLAERLAEGARLADRAQSRSVLGSRGVLQTPDGDVLQLLEDFDGAPLDLVDVRAHALMDVASAVDLGRQLFEALGHAHAQGIVHLAVTPSAVWVGREGDVRLDFGLACPESLSGDSTTPIDVRFCHPEWMVEGAAEPKIDLYGVTAILWWLVCGVPYRVSAAPVTYVPASQHRDGVPQALDEVFERGLGVVPPTQDKPLDAASLAQALDYVLLAAMNETEDATQARRARWIAPYVLERPERPEESSILAVESIPGSFTEALKLFREPVGPSPMTFHDVDSRFLENEPSGTPTPQTPPPPAETMPAAAVAPQDLTDDTVLPPGPGGGRGPGRPGASGVKRRRPQPSPGAPGSVAPGSRASGAMDPGSRLPDSDASGPVAPATPGSRGPGSVAPAASGSRAPGSVGSVAPAASGSVAPATPGSRAPGSVGSVAPAAPGSVAPATPGSRAPDPVAPGPVAPGPIAPGWGAGEVRPPGTGHDGPGSGEPEEREEEIPTVPGPVARPPSVPPLNGWWTWARSALSFAIGFILTVAVIWVLGHE